MPDLGCELSSSYPLQPPAPVAGFAARVGHRDDEDLLSKLGIDDREREPLHYEPTDIRRVLGCLPRAWVLGDETNGLADGGQKLDSQALAPQLVASDLIDQLFVGVFVVADRFHQRQRLARIAWILA